MLSRSINFMRIMISHAVSYTTLGTFEFHPLHGRERKKSVEAIIHILLIDFF